MSHRKTNTIQDDLSQARAGLEEDTVKAQAAKDARPEAEAQDAAGSIRGEEPEAVDNLNRAKALAETRCRGWRAEIAALGAELGRAQAHATREEMPAIEAELRDVAEAVQEAASVLAPGLARVLELGNQLRELDARQATQEGTAHDKFRFRFEDDLAGWLRGSIGHISALRQFTMGGGAPSNFDDLASMLGVSDSVTS